jgi:hypothetical protein
VVGGKLLKCTEKRGTLQEMTGKWGASFQGEKQKKRKIKKGHLASKHTIVTLTLLFY